MGNRNRPTNHQCDVEGVEKLLAIDANSHALFDVISDAIVASQNGRRNQTHQLFRLLAERAVFVGLRVEREETFDAEMPAAEQFFVHLSAISIEFIHASIVYTPSLFVVQSRCNLTRTQWTTRHSTRSSISSCSRSSSVTRRPKQVRRGSSDCLRLRAQNSCNASWRRWLNARGCERAALTGRSA